MKRLIVMATLIASAMAGLHAQNCEALVAPFFNGNEQLMNEYPREKFEYRCKYARNAFYFSDTIPAGAKMHSLTEVVERGTGKHLEADAAIDLESFSYYAYNFNDLQLTYREVTATLCFATPGSEKPYLVLRSVDETYRRTEFPELYDDNNR